MTLLLAALIHTGGLSQSGAEAAVYAALLGESYHGVPASQMVVKDTTVAMPTLSGSSREWLREFESVPPDLLRQARRVAPTHRHPLDATLFSSRTRLMPASDIDAIFTGVGVEENWSAFRSHAKARGWLAFSDALLGDDQLNALVYYEARCGGVCGEGGYVWFRRNKAGSPWRVARRIVSWAS